MRGIVKMKDWFFTTVTNDYTIDYNCITNISRINRAPNVPADKHDPDNVCITHMCAAYICVPIIEALTTVKDRTLLRHRGLSILSRVSTVTVLIISEDIVKIFWTNMYVQ